MRPRAYGPQHGTDDGIKMGEAIGAKIVDLEWEQVHPIVLVKPEDADAKIKLLATEILSESASIGTLMGCVSTCKRQPHL